MERLGPGESYTDARKKKFADIKATALAGLQAGGAPVEVLGVADQSLRPLLEGRDPSRIRTLISYATAGMELVTDSVGRAAIQEQRVFMENALAVRLNQLATGNTSTPPSSR